MTQTFWDERYGRPGYFYGTEPNDFLREQAPRLRPGARVLSLGEGEGRNATFLAGLGHRVLGVDGSEVAVDKARALAAERGVGAAFERVDLETWEPEGSFDAVVSIFCHLPSALRRRVHRRMADHLVPGGLWLVEAYTPKQLERDTGGPKDRDMLLELHDLLRDFPGWRVLHGEERVRPVMEGTGHVGDSDVVQAVLEKPAP